MSKFISGRQPELKIGIPSYTENKTVLEVTGNVGIGTTNAGDKLTVSGKVQIQQDSGSNNRLVFRGQPSSSYRWNVDNYSSSNEFRIFREDDATAANGSVAVSISTTGTVTATKFSGDGSLLTNLPSSGGSSQWITTNAGIHTLSNVGIGTTNPTSALTVQGNALISGVATVNQVITTNNGGSQNIRIGDDAWIGDLNVANSLRISGVQNGDSGFIVFGNQNGVALGRTGTGPLYYGGDFNVAGIITASSFSGNATSSTYATSSGISTSVSGGTASVTQLNVSGVSTFTGGPILVGSATSTGTASQPLQVTGGAYVNGNVGVGITNPQEKLYIGGVSTVAGISTSGDIFIEGGLIRNYEFTDYANLDSKLIWRRYASGSSNPTTTEGLTDLIKAATFVSQGTTANITAFTFSADAYSVEFVGYFYAATTGLYTFGVNSDDASDLFIDGKLVAYHYGGHGAASSGTPSIGGTQLTAYLKKGYHRLYTRFQENSGGDIHEILYKTPGSGTFAVIPASVLFHHPTDLIVGVGDNISIMSGSVGIGTTRPTSNLHVVGNALVTGIVTASGGFNLGISSAGTSITSGPVTRLNFIGAGNTFAVNGTTVDISIAGGGGGGASISTTAPSNPSVGSLWYNSDLGRTFIYYNDGSSSQWVDSAPFNIPEPLSTPGKSSATITATEGQTAFSVSYTAGYIDVFLNGIRLNSTEYIAADGSTITLLQGATAGDILDVVEYRMGIGDTGPQGLPGPLSGVTSITTNGTYYPVFVAGTGNQTPSIRTETTAFSFNPSTSNLTIGGQELIDFATNSTNAHLYVRGASGANSREGKIRFGGTFANFPADTGVRLISSMRSGFSTGTWGTEYLDFYLNSTTNDSASDTNQALAMRILYGGKVGIGLTNPSEKLHVSGNILASGDINSNSDIKLKTNIKTLSNSLEKVLQMRGVEFDRIDIEGKHQIGVIAQEIEEVYPDLVSESNGIKSVSYGNITAILIEAIKEQQEQINTLTKRIEELEGL